MGSRFMHLLIADYVMSELAIHDKTRALLGAIAPDAAKDKRAAHFKGELHPYAYNSPVDYGRFIVKYRDRFQDTFFIGYLTHLVTDDIWTMKTDFTGFEARVKKRPELYEMYHADLWLCNAKLDRRYAAQSKRIRSTLAGANEVAWLDEVDASSVLTYKQEALHDFDYPEENLSIPLRLFTLEEMVHYVERSKSKSLDICRAMI